MMVPCCPSCRESSHAPIFMDDKTASKTASQTVTTTVRISGLISGVISPRALSELCRGAEAATEPQVGQLKPRNIPQISRRSPNFAAALKLPKSHKWDSCAVVGNSGAMLAATYKNAIDSHHMGARPTCYG